MKKLKMILGDRLAELLVKNGVDKIFGLPGGQTLPLYDGIYKLKGKIEHVLMRDERSAGFAADAYARLTRKVGVCDATVGPGATNLVSPIAEAYCSSIPILAIISDIPRAWEHRRERGNASQAIDQLELFKSISKWQISITDPTALDDIIDTAFRIATTGKPGPVVIAMPDDIGPMEIDFKSHYLNTPGAHFPRFRQAPDREDVSVAIKILKQSKKTVLVAGGGVHLSNAHESLQQLAERLGSPVLTTISGKGSIAETHDQSLGVVGVFGNPVANQVLQDADLIFYIGCKIGQLTTLRFNFPPKSTRIIHLDSDAEELGRNYPNTVPLLADAKLGMEALLENLPDNVESSWLLDSYQTQKNKWYDAQIQPLPNSDAAIKPQQVMEVINRSSTAYDWVVCDASLASGWASAYYLMKNSGQRFIAPRGLATLGWGAPASIAASLALKQEHRILHLAGDGGFGYSVQELETMARLELPIVTLIFNNSTLGWIKHIQKDRYQERYISTDFTEVDFATVSAGFGVEGYRVTKIEELTGLLKKIQKPKKPVLFDVMVDQWVTPVLSYTE